MLLLAVGDVALAILAGTATVDFISSEQSLTFVRVVKLVDVVLLMATHCLIDWFIVGRQFRQLLRIIDVSVVRQYMWTTTANRALVPLGLEIISAIVTTSLRFLHEGFTLYSIVPLIADFKVSIEAGSLSSDRGSTSSLRSRRSCTNSRTTILKYFCLNVSYRLTLTCKHQFIAHEFIGVMGYKFRSKPN